MCTLIEIQLLWPMSSFHTCIITTLTVAIPLSITLNRVANQSETKSHISHCATAQSRIMHMGKH